jgi:hypothetical protein
MNETIENITKEELWKKISGFYERWKKDEDEYKLMDFFRYLTEYPESMCKNDMTPALKELIAETYIYGIERSLACNRIMNTKNEPEYTFDDLSIIFDRSKASIHEAIKEYERIRPEIIKKCEEEAYRSKHLNEVADILQDKFKRYFSIREAEEYEKTHPLVVMHDGS